jgi:hypothetical protein
LIVFQRIVICGEVTNRAFWNRLDFASERPQGSMETLLIKIFATALALSQVMTAPDAVKTQFDRDRDRPQVAQLLHAGCTHMVKAFEIEDINIDDLIATAMDDPQAIGASKALRGIDIADLQTAYRQFCKNETVARPAVDLGDVIDFYNKAVANLPDHSKLKGLKLPGASIVLDRKGQPFAEVFEDNQRRIWCRSPKFRSRCAMPSWPPRTSASKRTGVSTSMVWSGPSSATSRRRSGRGWRARGAGSSAPTPVRTGRSSRRARRSPTCNSGGETAKADCCGYHMPFGNTVTMRMPIRSRVLTPLTGFSA